MHLDNTEIEIERAHWIEKPDTNCPKQRLTVIKLLHFKDRDEMIQNAKSLKGSNLFIREMFSDRVEQRRPSNGPERKKGSLHTSASTRRSLRQQAIEHSTDILRTVLN